MQYLLCLVHVDAQYTVDGGALFQRKPFFFLGNFVGQYHVLFVVLHKTIHAKMKGVSEATVAFVPFGRPYHGVRRVDVGRHVYGKGADEDAARL